MMQTTIDNLATNIILAPEQANIATLIALGKDQGFVTHSDIVSIVPESLEDTSLLDEIFAALLNAQIPYSEEEEDETDQDSGEDKVGTRSNGKRSRRKPNPLERVPADDLVSLYFAEANRIPLLSREEEIDLAKRIERGRMAREELSHDNPGPQRRQDLHKLVEDGWAAREHLIRANSRLVISVAKRYNGRGVSFLDLIQEGNIGLMRAIKKYDYTQGYKFSTYATWWIRQAISRAIANQGRTIRVPAHTIDKITRVLRTKRKLIQSLHRDPTIEEIAEVLDTSPDNVRSLIKTARHPLSLEQPVTTEGDIVLGDLIENINIPAPDEKAADHLLQERIRNILTSLPPREARILELRYGLADGKCYTMQEIGEKMGVTRERIRQIEAQALRRLRQPKVIRELRDYLRSS
jgi:RNA polymerase primary sigma factor